MVSSPGSDDFANLTPAFLGRSSRLFERRVGLSESMERTCSKCQITYGKVPDNLLVCPRCGDEWFPPLAMNVESETSHFEQQSRGGASARLAATIIQPSQTLTGDSQREVNGSLPVSQPKSPALAALLSFLLVGMGQIYLGQVEKGLCMLVVVFLFVINSAPGPLGIVLLLVNVLDAFLLGRKVKDGRPIRKWQFFFSRNERWEFEQFIVLSADRTARQESELAIARCEKRPRNH